MKVLDNPGRKQTRRVLYSDNRNSIDQDIKPLLKDKNDYETIGGFFAVIVLVFTLIEYLGRLRYGNSTGKDGARDATKWVREYMGRSNSRYSEIGGLLIDMFRNGTVHVRIPKQYLLTLNSGFGWEIVKNERQSDHLKLKGGRTLVISLNQLVTDLEKAIDLYWEELNALDDIEQIFLDTYYALRTPVMINDLIEKKEYLKKDLEIIQKE